MSSEKLPWWETEIPRLRVLVADLDRRLDKMAVGAMDRPRLFNDRVKLQFELDNAIRAAELHRAKLQEHPARSRSAPGRQLSVDIENMPRGWDELEIAFLSDERLQIRIRGGNPKTYNYAELGFEDRRSGKQNSAWLMLSRLAESRGVIKRPPQGQPRASDQKRIQEIRNWLQQWYKLEGDPIPFNGNNYVARFKINRRPAFDT
jgi:hypothetical protein